MFGGDFSHGAAAAFVLKSVYQEDVATHLFFLITEWKFFFNIYYRT